MGHFPYQNCLHHFRVIKFAINTLSTLLQIILFLFYEYYFSLKHYMQFSFLE